MHTLQPHDPASKVNFYSWFVQSVVEEAWFHLQGYVNMQNNCYWNSKNPHLTHKTLLYPLKVRVQWTVSAGQTVVPLFLNVIILKDTYVE
jgi:hypothetical protein